MRIVSVLCVLAFLLAPGFALAHPHFNKSVQAKLGDTEATITYNTTPANLDHAKSAAVGTFMTPRRPTLNLSAPVKVGSTTLAAGDYTIGVIKNSDTDWTMALHKGKLGRGMEPDMANVIKLDSMYSDKQGDAEHMLIDITPGMGKLEGKPTLTLHFGTMFLAGSLE